MVLGCKAVRFLDRSCDHALASLGEDSWVEIMLNLYYLFNFTVAEERGGL